MNTVVNLTLNLGDLSVLSPGDLLQHLTPEHWAAIAEKVVLNYYQDPESYVRMVNDQMLEEARPFLLGNPGPYPEWIQAFSDWDRRNIREAKDSVAHLKNHRCWRDEQTQRLKNSPLVQAISQIDARMEKLVQEKVQALVDSDEKLKAVVAESVGRYDLREELSETLMSAFSASIGKAFIRRDKDRREKRVWGDKR